MHGNTHGGAREGAGTERLDWTEGGRMDAAILAMYDRNTPGLGRVKLVCAARELLKKKGKATLSAVFLDTKRKAETRSADAWSQWLRKNGSSPPKCALSPPSPLNEHAKKASAAVSLPVYKGLGPREDDLRQGQLGDCGVAAALAAIAFFRPELIKNAIRTITSDGRTMYSVTLYNRGRPYEYVLDGEFYFTTNKAPKMSLSVPERFLYAGSAAGVLWPALLEQALAIHHCAGLGVSAQYGLLESLDPRAVLAALAPSCDVLAEGTAATLVHQLDACRVKLPSGVRLPVFLGTKNFGPPSGDRCLYGDHWYRVVGIVGAGANVKLLLRNPHNRGGKYQSVSITIQEARQWIRYFLILRAP